MTARGHLKCLRTGRTEGFSASSNFEENSVSARMRQAKCGTSLWILLLSVCLIHSPQRENTRILKLELYESAYRQWIFRQNRHNPLHDLGAVRIEVHSLGLTSHILYREEILTCRGPVGCLQSQLVSFRQAVTRPHGNTISRLTVLSVQNVGLVQAFGYFWRAEGIPMLFEKMSILQSLRLC
jgi:hypothetical protein